MCELFGLSSRHPVAERAALEEFARHGGATGPHRDGWGLAHYHGRDAQLLREPAPASESACLRFIEEHPFSSALVVGHVRHATQGRVALANSQPFARELGGFLHVFAHNGDLDSAGLRAAFAPVERFRPLGETDSEYAFCALLEALRALWGQADGPPPLAARFAAVARFAERLRGLGPANFLYADGDALFVHGHRRMQRDGGIRPPGLHWLARSGSAGDAQERIMLLASLPLTGEAGWRPLAEGELLAVRGGAIVLRAGSNAREPVPRIPVEAP